MTRVEFNCLGSHPGHMEERHLPWETSHKHWYELDSNPTPRRFAVLSECLTHNYYYRVIKYAFNVLILRDLLIYKK